MGKDGKNHPQEAFVRKKYVTGNPFLYILNESIDQPFRFSLFTFGCDAGSDRNPSERPKLWVSLTAGPAAPLEEGI